MKWFWVFAAITACAMVGIVLFGVALYNRDGCAERGGVNTRAGCIAKECMR